MAENSAIEWTDHTMNFWIGCTNVSPACDHCYAESMAKRYGWAEWGAGKPRARTSPANWRKPLAWNRAALKAGIRPRVFSNSLSDWADPEVSDVWRADMFGVIRETPQLDWLLLTKRHALALGYLEKHAQGLTNIRVGMTVENEPMASVRLPKLRAIREAGFPTFVSYEPALGPIDWPRWIGAVGWLIAGGESGPNARPPHPDWFREARTVAEMGGVPFFFKQWGEWLPGENLMLQRPVEPAKWQDGEIGQHSTCIGRPEDRTPEWRHSTQPGEPGVFWLKVGKKRAGATLDGRLHRAFPATTERQTEGA